MLISSSHTFDRDLKFHPHLNIFMSSFVDNAPSSSSKCSIKDTTFLIQKLEAIRTKSSFKRTLGKLFRRMKQITKVAYLRERLISFTGKSPLFCPIRQREIKLVEVTYFFKQIKLSSPLPLNVTIPQLS